MQSAQVEDIRVQELLNKLGRLGNPALLFIQVVDYKHFGGNMIALGTDGFKYTLISPTSQRADAIAHYRTAHVWIRWNDGVDRSPYPRRAVRRKNSVDSHRRSYEETECYKPFQPNPCNNYIGDCVVRAVSGAMDLSLIHILGMSEHTYCWITTRVDLVKILIRKIQVAVIHLRLLKQTQISRL